jgi:hypothetical protein
MPRSGTQIYCPNCRKIGICEVVGSTEAREWVGNSARRWHRTDHPDIHWFRRVRRCENCVELFTTAEIDEGLLNELITLRDRVDGLRKTMETQKAAATSAIAAMDLLSAALGKIEGSTSPATPRVPPSA